MKNNNLIDTEIFLITITSDHIKEYKRLDMLLVDYFEDRSRNFIKKIFELGLITASNKTNLELKKVPAIGTQIEISLPPPIASNAKAEDLPLEVLYEDESIIVINKKAGMVVHPAPGHYTGTLVNALLYHCKDLKGIGQVERPGIVHRLDKGTSGVMVAAKTQKAHENLVQMFTHHDLKRMYQAIAVGNISSIAGTLKTTIGRDPKHRIRMKANVANGKEAITHFRVLESRKPLTHVEFKLETGRTHQIRVHSREILRAPLLNDELYASVKDHKNRVPVELHNTLSKYPFVFLHAKILEFKHPLSSELLSFETTPENEFLEVLEWIKQN